MNRNFFNLHFNECIPNSFERLGFATSTTETDLTINKHITKSLKGSTCFVVGLTCLVSY